jgi:hypothetical protein
MPNELAEPVIEEKVESIDAPVVETPEPAAKAPSLRESLSKVFDEASASPDGKPKPVVEAPAIKSTKDPIAAAKAVVPGAAPTPPAEPPIPSRLKAKLEAEWSTIPPKIRAEFHEYEAAIGRMANKYGKAAKDWEATERLFAPYAEMTRAEGGNFHSAAANLFETARILRQGSPEQKQGLLLAMVKAYNIPLPSATPGGDGSASSPSPGVAQLSPELLDRINRLESRDLTAAATAAHNVRVQVDNDLNAFVSDPKNVYVREPGFLDTMAALIQTNKAEGLADAYTQAAWLHEGPRNAEIARLTSERNASRVADAQRARRAGVSVNGNAPGTVRLDPSKMTLRDTLAAAYDGELDPT